VSRGPIGGDEGRSEKKEGGETTPGKGKRGGGGGFCEKGKREGGWCRKGDFYLNFISNHSHREYKFNEPINQSIKYDYT
jgi:hypothetical protein